MAQHRASHSLLGSTKSGVLHMHACSVPTCSIWMRSSGFSLPWASFKRSSSCFNSWLCACGVWYKAVTVERYWSISTEQVFHKSQWMAKIDGHALVDELASSCSGGRRSPGAVRNGKLHLAFPVNLRKTTPWLHLVTGLQNGHEHMLALTLLWKPLYARCPSV